MRPRFPDDRRCFLVGWVSAWAITTFLSSAVLAHLRMAPAAGNCGVTCFFDVADEVSPQAKLTYGISLGLMMVAARWRRDSKPVAYAWDAAAALLAMLLALAILPESWSRGFGVGIFASRFELLPTAIYLGCAVAGVFIGNSLESSCRIKRASLLSSRS